MTRGFLGKSEVAEFILDSVKAAHERKPFVGGLFNAYEQAVHYELFSAALVRGLNDPWQEAPIGNGQTTCDLVLPLAGGRRLWLEVKMWWFLYKAYKSKYVNYARTQGWPLLDWERLEHVTPRDHRAVLLIRIWDCEEGRAKSDKWLQQLNQSMKEVSAQNPRLLKEQTYRRPRMHTRSGDAVLWTSTAG